MSVTLTGTGGLFTRLGKEIVEVQRVVSAYGSSLNSGVEAIWDQFPNSDQDAIAIDGINSAREAYRTVHGSYTSFLNSAMSNTIIQQVNRDTTLSSKTLAVALSTLIAQMIDNTDSLNKPTVSGVVTPWASNKGNAVVNVTTTNQYGVQLDMALTETIKLLVTNDVSTGGTQYAETMSITGQPTRISTDYQYPGGSGASGSMNITNAETTGLLTDGGFESWTTNTPNYWTITVGSAGTNIFKETTNVVKGSSAMKMTSDGSTLVTFRQAVSSAILPNKVYAFNVWGLMSANDASGVVRFRLTNSSGTTLTDDAGNSLSKSVTMNGGSGFSNSSFGQQYAFWSTPRQLPTDGIVYFEVAFTTSPTSGRSLYLDQLGFVLATQLYAGGPFCAGFSKSTSNSKGDYYSVAITNSFTYNSFVMALDRFLNLRQLGLYFPTSNSPTVPDSLIG